MSIQNNNERKMYASLHTHSMDRFDSQNNPDELCAKFAEYGAKGFAITQHGVQSVVEPMRKAAKKYGLTVIPGIETYYAPSYAPDERRHLILLAMDDTGHHVIGKAITDANDADGMSVMNEDILKKYFAPGCEGHGHVIATSACIQGVVGMTLRKNDATSKKIEKAKRHQQKYGIPSSDPRIKKAEEKLEKLDSLIAKNKEDKQVAKKTANTKFTKKENLIKKCEEGCTVTEEYLSQMKADLAAEKQIVADAADELLKLTEEGKKLAKRRSMINKEVKELTSKLAKWESDEADIRHLKAQMFSDEELIELATEDAIWFRDLFGDGNFYMEVQNHGIETEAFVYPKIATIARNIGLPIVATNDVHLIENSEDELLRRRILRSLRFGNTMEQLQVGDDQLYIKTDDELAEALSQILPEDVVEESIRNIKTVFDRCHVEFKHEDHYPKYFTDTNKSAEEILKEEAYKGISWRFPNGFPDDRYQKRLDYELFIINSMGYANYHLVVKDYLEYGRELGAVPKDMIDQAPFDIEELKAWKQKNGWKTGFSIGPGRGSAVGSLVCYLIGITALDPIKYDLLFERFLNPERVSMPDIDSDLSNTVRQKVIEYVQYKYGKDAVCGIMTTNAQAPKGAVRIAAKYYGYDKYIRENGTAKDSKQARNELNEAGRSFLHLADVIAKKIPNDPGTSFDRKNDKGVTLYEQLVNEYSEDPDALEVLRWAKTIEGAFTAYGAHAAGIVISDGTPIKNHIPLRWNSKLNEWTTQMDMISVEENGFLKMDFLGLRTLDIITDCLRCIQKTTGRVIDPTVDIPLDDDKVFSEIFCKGHTKSVFQFESSGMRNMLQRFQPSSFEDLIILVAMFRPGPLQYLDGVIDVKHGKKAEYITKELIPLLENTYGAIVFQEQVMQIFQDLAGYTLGGADQVRRAMSKKKQSVLAAERPIFVHGIHEDGRDIKGCVANGISEEAANALFDQMTDFAKYAFNRSHAAVYALIGYYTAWLKLHYPAEFLMAAMNWAMLEDIPGLMQEAKKLGVTVQPPNVNKSDSEFTVDAGDILFGLGAVKSVGDSALDIIRERKKDGEYHSMQEFFARVPAKKNTVENLIKAGAFDEYCNNRNAMLEALPEIQKTARDIRDTISKTETLNMLIAGLNTITTDDELYSFELANNLLSKNAKARPKDALMDSLVKRKNNATRKHATLEEAIQNTKYNLNVPETIDDRMANEKEFLGAYVTAHPLDQYPEPETLGLTPIPDLEDGENRVYGMIRDLAIKRRKSDGKPMAFFTIEDKTGEIEACVFTKQYERLHKKIAEGKVVVLKGNIQTEERNETKQKKLFVEAITPSKKKQSILRMSVSSFWTFAATELNEFQKKYEQDDGHELFFYDELTGTIRKAKFKVSDDVEQIKGVHVA